VIDIRLLEALLKQLPTKDGRWSKKARDLWIQAMTNAVDLLFDTDSQ
jgi:hypothetical protein